MFRFEKEMIPVLKDCLAHLYKTDHFIAEFSTGNGVADLVFTTDFNEESLIVSNYKMMSMFINFINGKNELRRNDLLNSIDDKKTLSQLLIILEQGKIIKWDGENLVQTREYKAHTKNLISIEAKLKDWKAGFYQAMRYKFFSQKSFLALSEQFIHRVDKELLKANGIGLIAVKLDSIEILIDPDINTYINITSYYHLSESFVQKLASQLC